MVYAAAVVGLQWGDEGKGKIVDLLAPYSDVVARWGGGDNAGHTIVLEGKKYAFHLLPSGCLYKGVKNILGNGMLINPLVLMQELISLNNQGMYPDLRIAGQAHIICDWHKAFDRGSEELLKESKVGTTQRGIGPCAEDKASRKRAVRFEELIDAEKCGQSMRRAIGTHAPKLVQFHPQLRQFMGTNLEDIVDAGLRLGFDADIDLDSAGQRVYDALQAYAAREIGIYRKCGEFLAEYACGNVRDVIMDRKNRFVVLEGAQGHYLDLDQGTFPDVTSTSPLVAGAQQYLGLGKCEINDVIGVSKAYCTRVGNGDFDTELDGEAGDELREKGGEFGTTTGRPRRCGWANAAKDYEAVQKQGASWLAITKLDVLDGRSSFEAAYEDSRGDMQYRKFRGWPGSVKGCRTWKSLPKEAKDYLRFREDEACAPIGIVSVGPDHRETIYVDGFVQHLKSNGVELDRHG